MHKKNYEKIFLILILTFKDARQADTWRYVFMKLIILPTFFYQVLFSNELTHLFGSNDTMCRQIFWFRNHIGPEKFLYMKCSKGQLAKKLWAHWKSLTIEEQIWEQRYKQEISFREHIFLSVPRKTHIGSFIKTHATIQY